MWSTSITMRACQPVVKSCLTGRVPRQSTLLPGLQLGLRSQAFSRPLSSSAQLSGPGARSGYHGRSDGARNSQGRVLGLMAGAGIAFWTATNASVLHLESNLFSSSGQSVGKGNEFAWNDNTSGRGGPFGSGNEDDLPKSDVNLYHLGFGSVCGICAGVFIKKGLKLIAFLLGGAFILLQYLNTQKIIRVDWRALEGRYDSAIDSAAGPQDAIHVDKPASKASRWSDSRAARIWNRFVHFLTADFPSRGTFVAGLILGLRLG